MIWKGRRQSDNVEDQRGGISRGGMVGGGIGTVILVLAIYLLGGDPTQVINTIQVDTQSAGPSHQASEEENELAKFVSVVLADTEDVWSDLFSQSGAVYRKPKLVLYSGMVSSACGRAGASTGPFYCPGDEKVYIDLSFFNELRQRFRASGDFAMAYVIAHEVGHHVQKLKGIVSQVNALRGRMDEREFNRYLVKMELQADYFAGVWAHHVKRKDLLEEGDLEEALNAASAVGDDRIQQRSRGYVVPDSFTHGTSEQRRSWFSRGVSSGSIQGGDTFSAGEL
ncbi:MAG: zinc metallopeptidase [Spirochaetes bacterium]|nr:zinc metallopeptidase [Spirochaetota bacterium]